MLVDGDLVGAGRDVSNGTYRIHAVKQAFQKAARRLEALARGRKVDDLSLNYLQVRRLWQFCLSHVGPGAMTCRVAKQ